MPDTLTSPVIQLPSLTRSDLAMADRLSQRMVLRGLWLSTHRCRDQFSDCIEVVTQDMSYSAISLGVLSSGRYFYMDHRTSAVHLGDALAEVLYQAGLTLEF